MTDNRLAFLGEDEDVTEAPAEQVAASEPAEAPAEPAPITTGEPAAPPAAVQEQHIPIQAILDERDRRQAAEREAAMLRHRLEQIAAQQSAPKPVDLIEDPEARLAHERNTVTATLSQQLWNQKLDMSEMMARSKHGDEIVTEAQQAFKAAVSQDPALYQKLLTDRHPYEFVVGWHRQQRLLSEIGTDPEAYKARLRAEIEAEMAAKMPVQPNRPAVVPMSLASAPAAGRQEPLTRQDVPARLRGVL